MPIGLPSNGFRRSPERPNSLAHVLLVRTAARVGLVGLSILNVLFGVGVAALAAATAGIPLWVMAPAAAVATQGLYTLLWMGNRLGPVRPLSHRLFVLGESVALLVGVGALAIAIGNQLSASDPEYGPLTLLTLVALHGVVGLFVVYQRGTTARAATGRNL